MTLHHQTPEYKEYKNKCQARAHKEGLKIAALIFVGFSGLFIGMSGGVFHGEFLGALMLYGFFGFVAWIFYAALKKSLVKKWLDEGMPE